MKCIGHTSCVNFFVGWLWSLMRFPSTIKALSSAVIMKTVFGIQLCVWRKYVNKCSNFKLTEITCRSSGMQLWYILYTATTETCYFDNDTFTIRYSYVDLMMEAVRTSETSVRIILHGSTSQKTILNIILAAVRTWNLTTKFTVYFSPLGTTFKKKVLTVMPVKITL
jgi:hypothetical protein